MPERVEPAVADFAQGAGVPVAGGNLGLVEVLGLGGAGAGRPGRACSGRYPRGNRDGRVWVLHGLGPGRQVTAEQKLTHPSFPEASLGTQQ